MTPQTPPPTTGFLKEGDICYLTRDVTVKLRKGDAEEYEPQIYPTYDLKKGHKVVISGGPYPTALTGDNEPLTSDSVRYRFLADLTLKIYSDVTEEGTIDVSTRAIKHKLLRPVVQADASKEAFKKGDIVALTDTAWYFDKVRHVKQGEILRIESPWPVSPSTGKPVPDSMLKSLGVYAARKAKKVDKTFTVYNPDKVPYDVFTSEKPR
ncbi:hypothetical protein H0H92_002344 [Tricholoma furcatifolium]|nr:hypothetical protein H0H92_002344 [Tricholoma furcatifolium]